MGFNRIVAGVERSEPGNLGNYPKTGDPCPSVNPINHDPEAVKSLDAMENELQAGFLGPDYGQR